MVHVVAFCFRACFGPAAERAPRSQEKVKVDERELEREAQKLEKQIHYVESKSGATIAGNKRLRGLIDELRMDKLNVAQKLAARRQAVDHLSIHVVRLVNIVNAYYHERARVRMFCSYLIDECSREAEEFRKTMAELANRIEYHDRVMQDREDEFRRALAEGERQANAANEAAEEAREQERRRHQTLIETFDRLMHVFGTWDVDELVEKFLAKEEQNTVQQRYLEALRADADAIGAHLTRLQDQIAAAAADADRVDDGGAEAEHLRAAVAAAERRAAAYRERAAAGMRIIDGVLTVLRRIRARSGRCGLLASERPSTRRWALLRNNLRLVSALHSHARAGPESGAGSGAAGGAAATLPGGARGSGRGGSGGITGRERLGTPFDPRARARLEAEEEGGAAVADGDDGIGHAPREALAELARAERSVVILLNAHAR